MCTQTQISLLNTRVAMVTAEFCVATLRLFSSRCLVCEAGQECAVCLGHRPQFCEYCVGVCECMCGVST